MVNSLQKASVARLKRLISDYDDAKSSPYSFDSRKLTDGEIQQYITRSIAAIYQIAGHSSVHCVQASGIIKSTVIPSPAKKLEMLVGIIKALLVDLEDGFITSHATLIRGELFDDFLEMATHLIEEGYKDAAAVISGTALEVHLKKLCENRDIAVEQERNGSIQPIKADRLNAELAKSEAYNKLDQKSITAWLGLRNNAAHGNYKEYDKAQVTLTIDSVRNFIARHPE